jgi:hypothetical protein
MMVYIIHSGGYVNAPVNPGIAEENLIQATHFSYNLFTPSTDYRSSISFVKAAINQEN